MTDAPDPAGYATGPEIDIPEVKAEVEAAFGAYERALVSNDVAMLDRLLHHGHVLKCGPRSWRTKAAPVS